MALKVKDPVYDEEKPSKAKPAHPDDMDLDDEQRQAEIDDLNQQFADEDGADEVEAKESDKLEKDANFYNSDDSSEEDSGPTGLKRINGIGSLKKAAPLGIGLGGLLLLVLAIALFLFLASLKDLHFSNILRSTGFAASQAVMREAFSEGAYTEWTIDKDTTELPKSRLRDKIFSDDMRDVQRTLEDQGQFHYMRDPADATKSIGFEVDGRSLTYDQIAGMLREGAKWNDLTIRERLTARKFITDSVKDGMVQVREMEVRSFRNGFWKGFREATGIKMSVYRDIIRDKLGEGTIDETKNTDAARMEEDFTEVRGTNGIESGIPEVNEAEEAMTESVKAEAKRGIRLRAKDAFGRYLESKGTSLESFNDGASKVSSAVFAITMFCIGHDLAHTSDRINEQMEMQLARDAHRMQTTPDQKRVGDFTSGDARYVGASWGASDGRPEAAAAALYQEDAGIDAKPSVAGAKIDTSSVPRMNISLPFLDWLKPIDEKIITALRFTPVGAVQSEEQIAQLLTTSCGVVMNPYAQGGVLFADVIVSLFTLETKELIVKSLQAAAMFAGFATVGEIIQNYINSVAGASVDPLATGADKYSTGHVGTDYLNSQTARGTTYAAPETKDEARETKLVAMNELRDRYNHSSPSERYLAISNPFSLTGKLVARMPTSAVDVSNSMASFVNTAAHMFSQPLQLLSVVMPKVGAAAKGNLAYDNDYFGVNQWGWTTRDWATMRNTNMFDNAAEVEADMARDPNYYAGLDKCYGSGIFLYQLADATKYPTCTRESLTAPRAVKWRIYKLHDFAITQLNSRALHEN